MKGQYLACRQSEVQIRALWHHSNQALDQHLLLPDIMIANPRLSTRGPYPGGENAHGRRLPRAVGSKKSENFSGSNFEKQSVERGDLALGLLGSFGVSAGYKSSPGAHRWRRVIDLAEFHGTNAYSHKSVTPTRSKFEVR